MTAFQYETPYGLVEITAEDERRAKQKLFSWLKEMARVTDSIRVSYNRWGVRRCTGGVSGRKEEETCH